MATYTRMPSGKSALIMWCAADPDVNAIIGGRVGTDLDVTLPAIRISLVDGGPDVTGETNYARPQLQVECWARSAVEADRLMWTLVEKLPTIRGTTWAPSGAAPAVYVSGASITLGPVEDKDDPTNSYRQYADVELHVHHPVP
jgi:hypothetical protein